MKMHLFYCLMQLLECLDNLKVTITPRMIELLILLNFMSCLIRKTINTYKVQKKKQLY
jgi:hypothetical protein